MISNFRRAAAPCNTVFDYEDVKTLKLYENAYNAEVYQSHQHRVRQNKRISQNQRQKRSSEESGQLGNYVTKQTWHIQDLMINPKKVFNFHDFVNLTKDGSCPPVPLQRDYRNLTQRFTEAYVIEQAQKSGKHHFQPALFYEMNKFYHNLGELRFPMVLDNGDFACGYF